MVRRILEMGLIFNNKTSQASVTAFEPYRMRKLIFLFGYRATQPENFIDCMRNVDTVGDSLVMPIAQSPGEWCIMYEMTTKRH